MLFWLGLTAGAIIGWVVEWVIDWRYWRSDLTVASDEESRLRKELEVARLEIGKLQNQIQMQAAPLLPSQSADDRLQDINGIGQVYARKLNDAGIHTFAQLSESSIDRLTEIINPQDWQTLDFDSWIRQARTFVQSTAPATNKGQ
ncbi:MAG: helix-hairpin-helix domain-containing protein [Caldilineaceae bacterium]